MSTAWTGTSETAAAGPELGGGGADAAAGAELGGGAEDLDDSEDSPAGAASSSITGSTS